MAQKTRVALKEYFETGDIPTEGEFIDLIDSFYNFEDDSDSIIEDISHAQLLTLMAGFLLIEGKFYRIIDYKTKYNQPITDIVKTAQSEALIVMAVNKSQVSKFAKSGMYPQDIIHYDVDDILCEDGITPRLGKIYYRKDTLTGNSIGYDFRNVFFARGKCNHALYDPATTYNEKNLVRVAGFGVYVSVKNGNVGNNPLNSPDKWWVVLDLTDNKYWGWDSNCNGISFDMADTIEVPTFWILGEETNTSGVINGDSGGLVGSGFKNYVIEPANKTKDEIDAYGLDYSLYKYSNTVFFIRPDVEPEMFLGGITIKSGDILGAGVITGNNTLDLHYNDFYNNLEIDILKNNIGEVALNVPKLNSIIGTVFYHNTIKNSNINKIKNCMLGGNIYDSNVNILENVVSKGSISKINFNSVNDIILNGFNYTSGFQTRTPASGDLNLKDATHIKSFVYTKNWFKDSAGTNKISYIDATNTIIYALPTD